MLQRLVLWILLVYAFIGVSSRATAQQQTRTACRRFVQEFYDWYVPLIGRGEGGRTSDIVLQRRPQAFGSRLLRELKADAQRQANDPNEIVGLDFDPFVDSQDPADHYQVRRVTLKGNTCSAEVWPSSLNDTAEKINKPDVVAVLERRNGRWRFVNFRYPPVNSDLLTVLAEERKEQHER